MSGREELTFSYNWNAKLGCRCFTTIRLHDENRFAVGAVFEIVLGKGKKRQPYGRAVVRAVRKFTINQLGPFQAMLDTGYSLEETKVILRRMYSHMNDWTEFDLVLLEFDRKAAEQGELIGGSDGTAA